VNRLNRYRKFSYLKDPPKTKITMKRNIIIAIALAFVLSGCSDDRKPVISIADLMVDKIMQSADTSKTTVHALKKLRQYDGLLYKALLKEDGQLPKKYFYSRRGSCCPCAPGGSSCCRCSSGSALAIPAAALAEVKDVDRRESMFMLAKMSAVPQAGAEPLVLTRNTIDSMVIFTLPEGTKAGKYLVSFKGDSIDLALVIEVDEEGRIEISDF
jgi:hypothetical protein